MVSELPEKRARFVEEYLVDFNGTRAATRAGYSPRTAHSQASRLLSDAKVQEAVAEGRQRLTERCGIQAEQVLHELGCIAFSDIGDYFREGGFAVVAPSELTEDQRAAVARMDGPSARAGFHVRLHDKLRALELLGQYLGLDDRSQREDETVPVVKVIELA